MATLFKPQIVTSNHMLEGDVIYFKAPAWTRNIEEAKVACSPEEAEKLLAAAKAYPHETVGVEFTEVDVSSGVPRPVHFREEFRTKGPSNYFHGKQAENV